MTTKLSLDQLSQCEKTGKAFELIAQNNNWDESEFVTNWLKSDLTTPYIIEDPATTCQSATYLSNDIINTLNLPQTGSPMNNASLYWVGYLLMHWIYSENKNPSEIAEKYNIKEILLDYPILHTLATRTAIDEIKKDYIL